jgi:hypothetical protein
MMRHIDCVRFNEDGVASRSSAGPYILLVGLAPEQDARRADLATRLSISASRHSLLRHVRPLPSSPLIDRVNDAQGLAPCSSRFQLFLTVAKRLQLFAANDRTPDHSQAWRSSSESDRFLRIPALLHHLLKQVCGGSAPASTLARSSTRSIISTGTARSEVQYTIRADQKPVMAAEIMEGGVWSTGWGGNGPMGVKLAGSVGGGVRWYAGAGHVKRCIREILYCGLHLRQTQPLCLIHSSKNSVS